jgi:hypothetical protein
MSPKLRRICNFFIIAFIGLMGALLGAFLSRSSAPTAEQMYPLPHHVPKYAGGVSLRFAMVHDVIHERFPRHGNAYYEERNRRAIEAMKEEEAKLAQGANPSDKYWAAVDDLGVGLERLGKHEEAVALMRKKLKQQWDLTSTTSEQLYSSYANLGTFLILWQIAEGFDKPNAKERTRESIDLIHKAIQEKPDSHFGREIWQVVLEEFVLAALDRPELLLQYDMVGNRLDKEVNPATLRSFQTWRSYDGVMAKAFLKENTNRGQVPPSGPIILPDPEQEVERFRSQITKVGAEERWADEVKTSHTKPVSFDEPALGIIGMWRYGGGANPHFALALGEIMLRVGQRYIAWTAYERAAQLGDPLGPKFVEHCRNRQKLIEGQLPPADVADLRPKFEKELAFGQRYQKAYQDYEARRIRAGASIDDPHFYDAFNAEQGPIASPVGTEDHFVIDRLMPRPSAMAAVLLSAGICAFLTACLLRFLQARRAPVVSIASSPPASAATADWGS